MKGLAALLRHAELYGPEGVLDSAGSLNAGELALPGLSVDELAHKIRQSPPFVRETLALFAKAGLVEEIEPGRWVQLVTVRGTA